MSVGRTHFGIGLCQRADALPTQDLRNAARQRVAAMAGTVFSTHAAIEFVHLPTGICYEDGLPFDLSEPPL